MSRQNYLRDTKKYKNTKECWEPNNINENQNGQILSLYKECKNDTEYWVDLNEIKYQTLSRFLGKTDTF